MIPLLSAWFVACLVTIVPPPSAQDPVEARVTDDAQVEDGDSLENGVRHRFTLEPVDPPLTERGPSATFYYALDWHDSVVFVYAESDEVDLVLEVEHLDDRGEELIQRDDDSGGGTTAYLRIEVRDGVEMAVRVTAKTGAKSTCHGRLHLFEAKETEDIHAAVEATEAALVKARAHVGAGDFDAARSAVRQALDQLLDCDGAASSAEVESSAFGLAPLAYGLGDIETALRAWHASLEFCARTLPEHHLDLAAVRGNIAGVLSTIGRFEEAETLFEQMLETLARSVPADHPNVLAVQQNLATTRKGLGDVDGARALEEMLLEAYSSTLSDADPDLQVARGNLAVTLKMLGDLNGARALEEKVLAIREQSLPEDHPELLVAQGNLAATMMEQGDLSGARALQERVLAARTRIFPAEHPDRLSAQQNLAVTMNAQGDFRGARQLFEQVLATRSRLLPEDHPELLAARGNLAVTMKALGELEAAWEIQEHVLESRIRNWPPDHGDVLVAKSNLASTRAARGNIAGARELQEQVLATLLESEGVDPAVLQVARGNLASFRARNGDGPGSQRLAQQLSAGVQTIADSLIGRSMREAESLLDERPIDKALSYSMGLGRFPPDPVGEELAFSTCESVRVALGALARLQRAVTDNPEAARLRSELEAVRRRMSATVGSSEDRFGFAEAVRERDRLERELLSIVQTGGARDSFLPATDPAAIAATLEPGEAALSFWRYQRWSFADESADELQATACYLVWLVRPDGQWRRIELGSADEIESTIERWRSSIGAPTREVRSAAAAEDSDLGAVLAERLLASALVNQGDTNRLWIVPAHALYQVPFDALPFGQGVLGDRFEIVQVSSLSDRGLLAKPGPGSRPDQVPSLLVLGGVRYDLPREKSSADDEASPDFAARPSASTPTPDGAPAPRSAGASVYALRSPSTDAHYEFRFGVLSWTRDEARNVAEYFRQCYEDRGAEPTLLTGAQATRERFEQLAHGARFLHLATHGWFAPESVPSTMDDRLIDEKLGLGTFTDLRTQVRGLAPSLLCGLAFAGANGAADGYGRVRGVMTAEELRALDLSTCELAVLSACETNVGVVRGGQGIASLQSALHIAGVRTAITSLWRVPDDVTQELMTEFYRRVWLLGEPKARALWAAKQKIREQVDADGNPLHTPYHWAGWVLSGDPE